MISFNELKKGKTIKIDNEPYEIIEAAHLFKGRGSSVLQTKIKNLITGNVILRTFHPNESFEEAEIEKVKVKFLYSYRDKLFFSLENNPSSRFDLTKEVIGDSFVFLKPNEIIEGVEFEGKIINI